MVQKYKKNQYGDTFFSEKNAKKVQESAFY